jgi:hypothetical protein
MQHYEQVVFVHINFGTLYATKDVVQVKGMKMEALSKERNFS